MLKRFKIWVSKRKKDYGLMMDGEWYVRYPDGQRSMRMKYRNAQDYAAIFGGTIHTTLDPRDFTTP